MPGSRNSSRPSSASSLPSIREEDGDSDSDNGGVRFVQGNGGGGAVFASAMAATRPPGDTPATFLRGRLRPLPIGPTDLVGRGLEARIYGERDVVYKAFEPRGGRFGEGRRDSEYDALMRLYEHAPGVAPRPLARGRVAMRSGAVRPAFAMERLDGPGLRDRELGTPELPELRVTTERFSHALRATGTSWDNTPPNIVRTRRGFNFIDVKVSTPGVSQPPTETFVRQTLRMVARGRDAAARDASVERAMHTTMLGSSRQPDTLLPLLPGLPSSLPPRRAPGAGGGGGGGGGGGSSGSTGTSLAFPRVRGARR